MSLKGLCLGVVQQKTIVTHLGEPNQMLHMPDARSKPRFCRCSLLSIAVIAAGGPSIQAIIHWKL